MTEQELRDKIVTELKLFLRSLTIEPDKRDMIVDKLIAGENLGDWAEGILSLIKEAGYLLPVGKAPLLTDEQILFFLNIDEDLRQLLKAQNDADNKWYGANR